MKQGSYNIRFREPIEDSAHNPTVALDLCRALRSGHPDRTDWVALDYYIMGMQTQRLVKPVHILWISPFQTISNPAKTRAQWN